MAIASHTLDRPGAAARRALADEMEAALGRHVLAAWFPRSVDREHGGFLCDFDHAWRPNGPQNKMLEFQARQTSLAAHAALAYPADGSWVEIARHGLRYLRDVMWDPVAGGWWRMLDRGGTPLEDGTKHGHGFAYAITACVRVYEVTGERAARQLAERGFDWLDRSAHDERYGGYLGFLRRDGTPIVDRRSDAGTHVETDTIGTPIGLKDANVHLDLLEAVTDLHRVSPAARVGSRLAELRTIARDRMALAGGMPYYFERDWTPRPDFARYGYELQAARRLRLAEAELGGPEDAATRPVVRRLVHHFLEHGWDDAAGGMAHSSGEDGAVGIDGTIATPEKIWWVQAELLRTLLLLSFDDPDPDVDHLGYFLRQWRWVREHVLDVEHGGWIRSPDDTAWWQRAFRRRPTPQGKGDVWKDGSHEGVALMDCIRMLRGLPADGSLTPDPALSRGDPH